MDKSIEQLISLSSNPYYVFSTEERKRLDDFLAKQSEQQAPAKSSGKNSEKNIPATVINKNIVKKETGVIPVATHKVQIVKGEIPEISDDIDAEVEAVEEIVHPDAVK